MASGLTVNFNYSYTTGANTQLGAVMPYLLPEVTLALRDTCEMTQIVSKDWSDKIAQQGDAIIWEDILGTPDIIDLVETPGELTAYEFEVGQNEARLDRWKACVYSVKEIEMLLSTNAGNHWDGFLQNTIKVIGEYVEDDILSLHASMPYYKDLGTALSKSHYPGLRKKMQQISKSKGPWVFMVSPEDMESLLNDTDLQNAAFSQAPDFLRTGNVFKLFNINTVDNMRVPYADLTTYGKRQMSNILFDPNAIKFFSRRLGVPSYSGNVNFVEIMDPVSGINLRMRLIFKGELGQPKWFIVVEILYGIKLYKEYLALEVNTRYDIPQE